jgi:epoxyqueuosine reductase
MDRRMKMTKIKSQELGHAIHEKALELGADLVGIANIADLKRSPSHTISGKMTAYHGVGTTKEDGHDPGVVTWPDGFKSAIVIAVAHPIDEPEMDWWLSGNTSGNHQLMRIVSGLAAWLESEAGIKCSQLPYHIERGGVYLKDAAVLAGLGCIGRNNMLITPQYGPRLRLRAMLTEAELPSAGAGEFDPCDGCSAPCLGACPQNAFEKQVYLPAAYGQTDLPGRSGTYNRLDCNREMVINEADFEEVQIGNQETAGKRVKYCRACELACTA